MRWNLQNCRLDAERLSGPYSFVHPVFTYLGYRNSARSISARKFIRKLIIQAAPDVSGAQPIELKPGQQAQADFTLSPVRAFCVSGSISGRPERRLRVLEDADGQQMFMSMNFDQRTGHFILPNVPPGSWTLRLGSPNQQGNSYEAEQMVTVDSSDVENLQVLLQPLPSISVDIANQATGGPPQVQVQLLPKDKHRNRGRLFAASETGEPQGALTVRGVEPGEYQVLAQAFA